LWQLAQAICDRERNMSGAKCPNSDKLAAYAVGDLPADTVDALAEHIDTCATCQATLATLDDIQDALASRVRQIAHSRYVCEPECQKAIARTSAAIGQLLSCDRGPADLTATKAPEELGEYRLMDRLGEGGMGTVYRAFHVKLKRVVAIKVLPKGRLEDEQAVARFEREMAAVGQLDHPNIVQAYDARELDGERFLVTEFVDGLNLAELVLRCGPLPAADACELVRQVAMGLDYAYRHELVHRDIKPSNLMLTTDGQAKILDLGLALLKAEQPTDVEMTADGQAMGTPDYMSPEQACDSHDVDIRADIYSLGCTLYHLLTGHPPFTGAKYKSRFDKMMAHVRDPVPPIVRDGPAIPEAVTAIVERLLAKDPNNRFGTPAEVVEAIGKLCRGCNLASLLANVGQEPQTRATVRKQPDSLDSLRATGLSDTRPNRSGDDTRRHEISARVNIGNFGCGMVIAVACLLIAAIPIVWFAVKPEPPLADARLSHQSALLAESRSVLPSPSRDASAASRGATVSSEAIPPKAHSTRAADMMLAESTNANVSTQSPAQPAPAAPFAPLGMQPASGGHVEPRPSAQGSTAPGAGSSANVNPFFPGATPVGPTDPPFFPPTHGGQPAGLPSSGIAMQPAYPVPSVAAPPQYSIALPSGDLLTPAKLDLMETVRNATKAMYNALRSRDASVGVALHGNGSLEVLFRTQGHLARGKLHGPVIGFFPSDTTAGSQVNPLLPSFWDHTKPSFYGEYGEGHRSGPVAFWDETGHMQFRGEYDRRGRNGLCCYFEESGLRMAMECRGRVVDQIHLISDGELAATFDSEKLARADDQAGPVLEAFLAAEFKMKHQEKYLRERVDRLAEEIQSAQAKLFVPVRRDRMQARESARRAQQQSTMDRAVRESLRPE
jgi:serine/threonine protein kinase